MVPCCYVLCPSEQIFQCLYLSIYHQWSLMWQFHTRSAIVFLLPSNSLWWDYACLYDARSQNGKINNNGTYCASGFEVRHCYYFFKSRDIRLKRLLCTSDINIRTCISSGKCGVSRPTITNKWPAGWSWPAPTLKWPAFVIVILFTIILNVHMSKY